ncbi:MAG: zinc ABC transporter substrate-binding protein [Pseudomonadota bacterium]
MKRTLAVSVVALCAALGGPAQADPPTVVTDILPVHGLVAAVMEGVGEPSVLITGTASPHGFAMRPSQAAALQDADLVVWMGEELSPAIGRAVENLSGEGKNIALLDVDGLTLHEFRDGPIFDHDGHEGHDEHAGHTHGEHGHDKEAHAEHGHDHDKEGHAEGGHEGHDHGKEAHEGHGHGEGGHAFEWAGLFDLQPGTYSWSFAKVDGDYADPAMRMVILAASDIEAVEEAAEELLEGDAATEKTAGGALVAADTAYSLVFDPATDMTVFEVTITEAGKYAFFTEHMPFEFEADEHFFKDVAGLDVEPVAQEPDGDHGHGHGHAHAHDGVDPHAWLDPENAEVWLKIIAEKLSELDPENAATYQANAEKAHALIDAAVSEAAVKLEPVRGERFLVFHDAYQYFEHRFKIEAAGAISIGDATAPSAARLAEIRDFMNDTGAECIFREPQFNPAVAENIAKGTGAHVGEIDPLGSAIAPGPAFYPMLIAATAGALVECLDHHH